MLCVEDYLDTLLWAKSVGGLKALIARADANTTAIADWVARAPWIAFLADNPAIRSNTSVCLKVVDPRWRLCCGRAGGLRRRSPRRERKTSLDMTPIATRRRACASGAGRPSRRATWRR
jgi:phosphoserine aminotransferase